MSTQTQHVLLETEVMMMLMTHARLRQCGDPSFYEMLQNMCPVGKATL